jgi:hypothetical protein
MIVLSSVIKPAKSLAKGFSFANGLTIVAKHY